MGGATQPQFAESSWVKQHARLLLAGALLLVPVAVLYADVFAKLAYDWWTDPNSSHGILIPPLAMYAVWLRRSKLISSMGKPSSVLGLSLLVGSLAVYFVGRLGAEFFLTRVSFLGILCGLLLFFAGWHTLKICGFPLLLLALSIPLPVLLLNTFTLPLQSVASSGSSSMLQFCSVPVFQDGNVLHLANTSLGVAEACSGLRSLESLVALSIIFGFFRWSGWLQRVLLVTLSVPLALFLNLVRITATGLIANYWDVQYAMGFFHVFSGWLSFVFALALMFGSASLIQRWLPSPAPELNS